MNTKMIRYILAKMLGVEAILLLLPALVSLIYGEFSGVYFLIPSGILIVIYLLVGMKKPEKRTIYGKEGMVIVASAWISTRIGRDPSSNAVTTAPLTVAVRSERKTRDASPTSTSPSPVMSNTPISLIEPKRFLSPRSTRYCN